MYFALRHGCVRAAIAAVVLVSSANATAAQEGRVPPKDGAVIRSPIGVVLRWDAAEHVWKPVHPAGAAFYDAELESRRLFRSPPFGRLVKLTVSLEDRNAAEKKAEQMAAELRERATAAGSEAEVLGPLPAYIARRAGKWRFHVVLRGTDPLSILGGDPGVPWSVDVDPESLL